MTRSYEVKEKDKHLKTHPLDSHQITTSQFESSHAYKVVPAPPQRKQSVRPPSLPSDLISSGGFRWYTLLLSRNLTNCRVHKSPLPLDRPQITEVKEEQLEEERKRKRMKLLIWMEKKKKREKKRQKKEGKKKKEEEEMKKDLFCVLTLQI